MNLVLLFKGDFKDKTSTRVCLSDHRVKHIKEIHKVSVGQSLVVGMLNGKVGKGCVVEITSKSIILDVQLESSPPAPQNNILILALPRPLVLKRTLLNAVTLGFKSIYLIQTNRVEKSYWNSSALQTDAIEEQLILGLEQAKDTVMPKVYLKKRFKLFIEDVVPELIKDKACFIAHPEGKGELKKNFQKDVVLSIGPEGGFVEYEVEKFKDAGFQLVSFGARILKTEAALPYFCGKVLSR